MLTIRNLTIAFGEKSIIENRSFAFPIGISKIEGPSGRGKSTLFRCLMGRLKPDSGSVLLDGTDLYLLNENERSAFLLPRLSVLPHDGLLLPSLTLEQNVSLYVSSSHLHPFDRKKYENLLSRLSFADYRDRKISTMSDGERRLASFIFALSKDTEFLILDEPFTKVDDRRCKEIGVILEEAAKNKTVLLVDHDGCLPSVAYSAHFLLDGDDAGLPEETPGKPTTKTKPLSIGHAVSLGFRSFSKRIASFLFSSVLFTAFCVFALLAALSVPKTTAEIRSFAFDNDPYEYLCVRDSKGGHYDQESLFSLGDGSSFMALVSYPSSLYAEDPLTDSVSLVFTDAVKDGVAYSFPFDKNLSIDLGSYSGDLSIKWSDTAPRELSRNATYLFQAYAVNKDLLFVSPKTGLAMIEDSFFAKIKRKDGGDYVRGADSSLLLGPIGDPAHGDYYEMTIADGEGVFLLPGSSAGKSAIVYGGTPSKVLVSGPSPDEKIHLSENVLYKLLLETTGSRYAAKRTLDGTLSKLGYTMYSELEEPYSRANESLTAYFVAFSVASGIALLLLIVFSVVMPYSLDKRLGSFFIYSSESPRSMALALSFPELIFNAVISVLAMCFSFAMAVFLNASLETVAFGNEGIRLLGGLFIFVKTPEFIARFPTLWFPFFLLVSTTVLFGVRQFFLERNKPLNLTKY